MCPKSAINFTYSTFEGWYKYYHPRYLFQEVSWLGRAHSQNCRHAVIIADRRLTKHATNIVVEVIDEMLSFVHQPSNSHQTSLAMWICKKFGRKV